MKDPVDFYDSVFWYSMTLLALLLMGLGAIGYLAADALWKMIIAMAA